ncbi:MAG: prepilin peptidase [Candidatus Woesebacteria bacterium]|nr:prepilin peptidase [Candidatus Woesebacteria bacterium]
MILQPVFIFLSGLIFGSFISALTWRYPRRISIKKGRSICPNCKNQIAWFDNVPLLSFLFLAGRCRNCKRPISWRYPAIELATGVGFLLIGLNFTGLILFCILEVILIIDSENQIIPDSFVFWGIFVVFLYTIYYIPHTFFPSLFAGFIAATLLLLIHLLTKGRGMGLGDVKFAVLGGLIVGAKLFLIWLFLAFLTGAVIGIILIIGRKAHLKSQIAFGPFLVLAIPLALIWGEKILSVLGLP